MVLETYRRALETQVDVGEVELHNLKDKVLAFIRNNTSGSAPMDIGAVTPGFGSCHQSTTLTSHGVSDSYPDLNNHEYAWHHGDRIGSGILAMSTHQEVQMVSCTVSIRSERPCICMEVSVSLVRLLCSKPRGVTSHTNS